MAFTLGLAADGFQFQQPDLSPALAVELAGEVALEILILDDAITMELES